MTSVLTHVERELKKLYDYEVKSIGDQLNNTLKGEYVLGKSIDADIEHDKQYIKFASALIHRYELLWGSTLHYRPKTESERLLKQKLLRKIEYELEIYRGGQKRTLRDLAEQYENYRQGRGRWWYLGPNWGNGI